MTQRFLAMTQGNGHELTRTVEENLARLNVKWSALTILHTSKEYQEQQRRLMAFIAVHRFHRFRVFLTIGDKREWRWSTRETYYTAILSAMTLLQEVIEPIDYKNLTYLKTKAFQELPMSPPPVEYHHLTSLLLKFDVYTLAAVASFTLGQRLSDTIKWRTDRISMLQTSHGTCTAITVVEGKVVPKIGPFTIFVHGQLGHILLQLAMARRQRADIYLFPQDTSHVVHMRLVALDDRLDVRSLRRGGLQAMAKQGASAQQLLMFSRHSSIAMLYRYLGHGAVLRDEAEKMWEVTSKILQG